MTKPLEVKQFRVGNSEIERIIVLKDSEGSKKREVFNYYCDGCWFISIDVATGARKADAIAKNYV